MAIDYSRLPRAQVRDAVIRMSFEDRANDVRSIAIRAVNDYNELAATPMDEDAFETAVLVMVAKLDTAMPTVPADLDTFSDQQLATLANSLALAEWDWMMRNRVLGENHRYWVRRASQPTPTEYLAHWRTLANYVRAKRGLTAIP